MNALEQELTGRGIPTERHESIESKMRAWVASSGFSDKMDTFFLLRQVYWWYKNGLDGFLSDCE